MELKKIEAFFEERNEKIEKVGTERGLATSAENRLADKYELRAIDKDEMKFILEWLSESTVRVFDGDKRIACELMIKMFHKLLKDGTKRSSVEQFTDALADIQNLLK